MPQSSSENSLVSTVLTPVRLDSGNLVVHDDTGYHNRIDLEELNYTNRELVNLENAAVNIENSSDVIIGPVTQFNVNGNVTIYQNGQQENQSIENVNREEEEHREENPENDINRDYLDALLTWIYLKQIFIKRVLIILIVPTIFLIIIIVAFTFVSDEEKVNFNETIYTTHIGPHKVLYRRDWKGLHPKKQTLFTKPVEFVVISHSQSSTCDTFENCIEKLQKWQKNKILLGYSDLWYNFYVSSEANIYVGRGWDAVSIVGNRSISIQVIGNFVFDNFESNMIDAVKRLIQQGLDLNKISNEYKLVGENQTNTRKYPSPGINVYNEIKTWQHFDPKIILWLDY